MDVLICYVIIVLLIFLRICIDSFFLPLASILTYTPYIFLNNDVLDFFLFCI